MSDYIKREDALKAVDDIVCDADDAERTCDRIIDLPSADVAPVRHGRWEECGKTWWCSECGFETGLRWDYCPDCGTKMDGGGDDEKRQV